MVSLMHLPLLSFKFFLLWQQLTPQLVAFICECVKLQSDDVRTATTSVQNALIKFNSALPLSSVDSSHEILLLHFKQEPVDI